MSTDVVPGANELRIADTAQPAADERCRAARYPISRWYVCPVAGRLAACLAPSRVRPNHLTLAGLAWAAAAAGLLIWRPDYSPLAAGLVLAAWLCDRTDGQLARLQRSASAWGAWLDANIDELTDVGLHVAVAWAAAARSGSMLPWPLLIAFLAGKYLFTYGVSTDPLSRRACPARAPAASAADSTENPDARAGQARRLNESPLETVRYVYHLPGNADVRIHVLVAALACGWLVAELGFVAAYYNLRWIVRYALVARRLRGVP